MVFKEINGRHHSAGSTKALSGTAKEIISIISPQYGGTFIDCTFGQGGYSKKILEFENTKVIALDRDIESEIKEIGRASCRERV